MQVDITYCTCSGQAPQAAEEPLIFTSIGVHMQGTNAHAILSEGDGQPARSRPLQEACWRRRRFWHLPLAHPLLRSCMHTSYAMGSGTVRMECNLTSAAVAHLRDWQVRREH